MVMVRWVMVADVGYGFIKPFAITMPRRKQASTH
jgi:hypothetical protein